MHNLIKILICFLLINFNFSLFSQEFKSIPDMLNKQIKHSEIKKINSGKISLANLPSTENQGDWVVYSDRAKNRLMNSPNGSSTGETLEFMEPLLVKQVKDNWLHVYDYINEDERGWIHAKYLVLSNWTLKSEGEDGKVSIPRKAIVLTSSDEMASGQIDVDDVQSQKNFYYRPSTSKNDLKSKAKTFEILFILKEQDGSVLLAANDVLSAPDASNNKVKVRGWIPIFNITDWDSRVTLEPARSEEALDLYSDRKLRGFKEIKDLNTCLETNFCNEKLAVVEFKVGSIRRNKMRKPVLKAIDDNTSLVVSIAKSDQGMEDDDILIWKDLLEELDKKSQTTNIIFAVDATKSMLEYLPSVAKSISKLITENERLQQNTLKFGLIIYRDYADGQDAFDYVPLTSAKNSKAIQKKIKQTKCFSSDSDAPEAQYYGLIKGLDLMDLKKTESNVLVLVGDCGNHPITSDSYNPEHNFDKVVELLRKYAVNLISYQVDFQDFETYYQFNEDAIEYVEEVCDKILNDNNNKELDYEFPDVGNQTHKLIWQSNTTGPQKFETLFARFIYSSEGIKMQPKYLEESVVATLSEYMKNVNDNMNLIREWLNGADVEGDEPPEGLILWFQEKMGLTRQEAIDFLKRTEVTTKAYVALDYDGQDVKSQVPVVFLTENERDQLIRSFRILLESNKCISQSDRKKCLRDNLTEVCKGILGPQTSTDLIHSLTLNQVWNLILGVDFADRFLKDKQLKSIIDLGGNQFNDFYDDFELKARDFCDNDYEHSDKFKSRRFQIDDDYFYWIPLEDLPGAGS